MSMFPPDDNPYRANLPEPTANPQPKPPGEPAGGWVRCACTNCTGWWDLPRHVQESLGSAGALKYESGCHRGLCPACQRAALLTSGPRLLSVEGQLTVICERLRLFARQHRDWDLERCAAESVAIDMDPHHELSREFRFYLLGLD